MPESTLQPFIEVRGLQKRIGAQQILRGLDLTIHHGECLAIIGGSGSGKSVTLKLLTGLMSATAGSILVDGEEITLQEINAELATAQVPQGADKKAIQTAALQRIVERRLMAGVAKDDGLDKQPEYLLRRRQLEDLLLRDVVKIHFDTRHRIFSGRII